MNKRDEFKVFSIKPEDKVETWNSIKRNCPQLTDWGIDKLSEGLADSVKSIVLEPHYVCKDHRNLYSNFYSKKFIESSPFTSRLHFFSQTNITIPDLLLYPKDYQSSYIGYSVIRPVDDRCLGRTIIDPLKLSCNEKQNFFCLRTEFKSHIGGQSYTVNGYPYISQDGDVTVCAHTALWGVCRYLSERYVLYREVYPFDLVNITSRTEGRNFPYRGMTYADYSHILSEFGAYPILLALRDAPGEARDNEEFCNFYSYIESGFPVVSSYIGHVVVVIGHTLDYSKNPTPDSFGFIDSSSFVKELIIMDDNCFPYQLLCERGYTSSYNDRTIDDIVYAVCPLPEKVYLPADKAREWALDYFKTYRNELRTTGNPPFVTRLFLTSNTAFKRRCLHRSIQDGNIDRLSYYIAEMNLPHFVWIMETSPLELYRQGKCSAEIVLDSTAGEARSDIIYMRIGNSMYINGERFDVAESPTSYPQYTHNLGEV